MIDNGTLKQIEMLIDEIEKIKIHTIELRNKIYYLKETEGKQDDR